MRQPSPTLQQKYPAIPGAPHDIEVDRDTALEADREAKGEAGTSGIVGARERKKEGRNE